jgi:hypothetical protein
MVAGRRVDGVLLRRALKAGRDRSHGTPPDDVYNRGMEAEPPGPSGRSSTRLAQCADAAFMIRPAAFGWNVETASTNRFQREARIAAADAQRQARAEFDAVVAALRAAGVETHAVDEPQDTARPDAVFPNNWVSLHHDGTVVLYPMLAPSRRLERRPELLAWLEASGGFGVTRLIDLTHHELSGRFLEGTGSVVFDHALRTAYACLSPRTHRAVLGELCGELGYELMTFDATDAEGAAVYHTNVVLSIGRRIALVCAEAVADRERAALLDRLRSGGRSFVELSRRQMAEFAGNALELTAADGAGVLALSDRALGSLDTKVVETLRNSVQRIVAPAVPIIETLGGGSVRCMIAEVFLPRSGALPKG